jgi:predicted ATPase
VIIELGFSPDQNRQAAGQSFGEGQGQDAEGLAEIRQGMVDWRATGHELARPHFLGLLVEAHEMGGQPEEGLSALAEARATADKTEERFWDAELYPLHGELSARMAATNTGSAGEERRAPPEESFLKAIEIARRQQAKSLELRAAVSLSRLWKRPGKKDEARQMLAAIHAWFIEGHDTPDLREAKALLDELA